MIGDGRDLEREVEDELRLVEASRPDEEMREPIEDWRFDPTDAQRYEIGLHTLLDAVEAEHDDPTVH
ncbi:hypothetical protein SAMN04488564_112220 [Lentzea waywayandensis]|uniref:Uncharacterized protein n=1 Tax=Lentzea waywayandensis TaxID=84724 RepID=A0A1I6FDR2_9PSEU|nr:hypothetical protein [Lentzea waywayandensis]SFR28109.1 hypothetical protein SAMN04488564_112220 [Lentzea waywayandensis]